MGDSDLGLGVLGVVVIGAVGVKGTVGSLLLIMTDGCVRWVEGWGRSGSSVVTESTGVWVSESEYCLPRVG